MTDLLRTLYDYACQHRMPSYLEDQTEYQASRAMRQRNYDELCQLLSPEGRLRLENFTGEAKLMHDLELESLFQAGLAMGLELSRL